MDANQIRKHQKAKTSATTNSTLKPDNRYQFNTSEDVLLNEDLNITIPTKRGEYLVSTEDTAIKFHKTQVDELK